MTTRPVRAEDAEAWLALRVALWPETDEARHRQEMVMMTSNDGRYAVFVHEERGRLLGFAEASLRAWAEGCLSSPVGYLEGWYVEPGARGRGVGRALLAATEAWARSKGCTEMASDTDLDNRASEAAHRKLGFEIAARVIAFRKAL